MRASILVILLCLISAACSAEEGRLILLTEPGGLDAWAGDRYLGRTPVDRQLPAGETRVRVAFDGDSVYRPPAADTTIVIEPGIVARVDLKIGRFVTVRSVPYGLTVMRGPDRLGETPLDLMLHPGDAVSLRLETPDGPVGIPVDSLLRAGWWEWRMRIDPFGARDSRGTPTWRKVGRIAMPGLAAALATAGILTEHSADDAYDRYRRTADPAEIRRHYDAARSRDRWAAAFWVGAEVSIAAAILSWILPDPETAGEGGSR